MSNVDQEKRIHGFDLLRLFSMVPIIWFHANETVFFLDQAPFRHAGTLSSILEYFSRLFFTSGFTVIALTCFLFGARSRPPRTWIRLFSLLLMGIVFLAWVEGEGGVFSFFFEWDVYHFLLVALGSLYLVRDSVIGVSFLGIIGAALLCLPIWEFFPPSTSAPGFWYEALIGFCGRAGGGGWPLLPWSGLLWVAYALGFLWGRKPGVRTLVSRMSRLEAIAWIAALAVTLPKMTVFLDVPVGPGFSCFTFRRLDLFWTHFALVIFLARVSLLEQVNSWLAQRNFARVISELDWSRHFGRCYLLQLGVIGIASLAANWFLLRPWAYDLFLLSVLPLVELLSRLITRLFVRRFEPHQDPSVAK